MNLTSMITTTAIGVLFATTASATDYQIKRSLALSAPADEVWHLIGDFCDIDDWHPSVKSCSLKVIDGSLARVITTAEGAEFVHKRIAMEPGLSYTYKTISSPLPIENFTATLSIEPFDTPLIMWTGRFSSDDPAMEKFVVEAVEAGLLAIENRFKAQ